MPRLFVKDDTRNPSGSTKDRASHLVVAKAIEYGYETSLRLDRKRRDGARRVGRSRRDPDRRLRPGHGAAGQARPDGELRRDARPGRRHLRPGLRALGRGLRALRLVQPEHGAQPLHVEGKKTAALEIARDLAPEAPDVVVVPTGDGVIVAGIAKGFADLVRCGLLPRVPRLVAVQPERSGAIARALRSGAPEITPTPARGASPTASSSARRATPSWR